MVSIVVPVFNAENYIVQTLQSVMDQSFTDWELILVDDLSTDRSAVLIEEFAREHPEARIRLLYQESNAGAAAARNRGVDEAQGRYIAFLDADDIWYPDKLEKQLNYMQKHEAAFCFTAYEFGDEEAKPTGKAVRVPKELTFEKALCRTVIFTSTVVIDTAQLGKVNMPLIASEDTATWWQILKTGVTGYGLNQPLVIYRRPAKSLSSNKGVAVQRIWKLYREIAGLGVGKSLLNLFRWSWKTTVRRAVDDAVVSHAEAIKRFTVLQLSVIGLILHTGIYAFFWFHNLYPQLARVRYSRTGINLGKGLRLYYRGHILILLIYFILLVFLSRSSGGMKTGNLKPGNVFSCEVTALLITNVLTYFQLSLLRNWLLPVLPFLAILVLQLVFAWLWSYATDAIYRRVFPPQETLVVFFGKPKPQVQPESNVQPEINVQAETVSQVQPEPNGQAETIVQAETGSQVQPEPNGQAEPSALPAAQTPLQPEEERLLSKLESRSDRFNIMRVMREADPGVTIDRIKKETLRWYGSVILCGADTSARREVMEYCYRHIIRVYLVPGYSDLLMQGMDTTDLYDAPVFALKEYTIRWEVRIVKRILEFLLCLLPALIALPFWIRNGRPKTRCLGRNKKEFTRYGCGFLNVLNGTMSLVGPETKEAQAANAELAKNKRAGYRYRIKPGILSYSQLHATPDTGEEDRLKMDLSYILHYSLTEDIRLILQSVQRIRIPRKTTGNGSDETTPDLKGNGSDETTPDLKGNGSDETSPDQKENGSDDTSL